jgi:mRNA interferase MazF
MYFKDFDKWNSVKKRIHKQERRVNIRAGEVRWVCCGVNIGSEIDGKGESFTRPMLVVHVIGSTLALVIPLSTRVKNVVGYVSFEFQQKHIALCVHQMRVISQKRILTRKGKISENRLEAVKTEIEKFFRFR